LITLRTLKNCDRSKSIEEFIAGGEHIINASDKVWLRTVVKKGRVAFSLPEQHIAHLDAGTVGCSAQLLPHDASMRVIHSISSPPLALPSSAVSVEPLIYPLTLDEKKFELPSQFFMKVLSAAAASPDQPPVTHNRLPSSSIPSSSF
jgi:hypothetical protein